MNKKVLLIAGAVFIVVLLTVAVVLPGASKKNNAAKSAAKQSAASQLATSAKITIGANGYSPNNVTVKTGATVSWSNADSSDHSVQSDASVTSDPAQDPNYMGSFILHTGNSYSHTFTKAGTYHYHCAVTNAFAGTVVVKDQ